MEPLSSQAIQTRLLLLRHGEVDWNGADDGEPPLTAGGVAGVEAIVSRLPRFDQIAASGQRPTRETAELLSGIRGAPVWWRDDLDEIRTGTPLLGTHAYVEWLDRLFDSYHVSSDGESLAEGAARLTAALRA